MIKIAVIEDEKNIRDMVCEKLRECISGKTIAEIDAYESAEGMLSQLEQENRYHIVFSDIDMPGMDGIDLGIFLKKRWQNLNIVYLTNHAQFAARSYYVEAYQYVLKQEMDKRLPPIMQRLIKKVEQELSQYIIVGNSTSQKKVLCADIIYIKKSKGSKYVDFFTMNEQMRERNSMSNVQERLKSHEFVVIERGCIVNMRHINSIREKEIVLSNGVTIEVSRLRITKVKEIINRYWGEL